MTFKNGKEMLETIQSGRDFYDPISCQYVFVYNEEGSIAVYGVGHEDAKYLEEQSKKYGDYWGAFLGLNGEIYDDPSYDAFDPNLESNLEWCNENFEGEWEDVTDGKRKLH